MKGSCDFLLFLSLTSWKRFWVAWFDVWIIRANVNTIPGALKTWGLNDLIPLNLTWSL